jgi:AmmeMemoRadiSam system protein B
MKSVREPVVAGLFYPADPVELETTVRSYLGAVERSAESPAKAVIAPHAGYMYSGPIAASAYARLDSAVTRVVLLGPAHRYPVRRLAAHSAEAFATPLGLVPVDPTARELPYTEVEDLAHAGEHSLEVHLPFLQVVLSEFTLVPLLVGDAKPKQVAEVLEILWGGPETAIVISSDLSHYHGYDQARKLDASTARAIVELHPEEVGPKDACGCRPIGGLLTLAKAKGLRVESVDLRNSGDTADRSGGVVGYGAFTVTGPN